MKGSRFMKTSVTSPKTISIRRDSYISRGLSPMVSRWLFLFWSIWNLPWSCLKRRPYYSSCPGPFISREP